VDATKRITLQQITLFAKDFLLEGGNKRRALVSQITTQKRKKSSLVGKNLGVESNVGKEESSSLEVDIGPDGVSLGVEFDSSSLSMKYTYIELENEKVFQNSMKKM